MNETDRILDVIEHPENYTDSELDALLHDPEMRRLYNMLCDTRGVLAPEPDPDIDKEWAQLTARTHRRHIFSGRKAAAAAIAVAIAVCAVAIGTGLHVAAPEQPAAIAISPDTTATAVCDTTLPPSASPAGTIVIFRENDLGQIVDSIAAFYGAEATFRNADKRHMRLFFKWNQATTLAETVENLNNFEQINIALTNGIITVD